MNQVATDTPEMDDFETGLEAAMAELSEPTRTMQQQISRIANAPSQRPQPVPDSNVTRFDPVETAMRQLKTRPSVANPAPRNPVAVEKERLMQRPVARHNTKTLMLRESIQQEQEELVALEAEFNESIKSMERAHQARSEEIHGVIGKIDDQIRMLQEARVNHTDELARIDARYNEQRAMKQTAFDTERAYAVKQLEVSRVALETLREPIAISNDATQIDNEAASPIKKPRFRPE